MLNSLKLHVHVLVIVILTFVLLDDLTRSNMGSSGDSEKIIQRLNDELREAQEIANKEKHKFMELQGNVGYLIYLTASTSFHNAYTPAQRTLK